MEQAGSKIGTSTTEELSAYLYLLPLKENENTHLQQNKENRRKTQDIVLLMKKLLV